MSSLTSRLNLVRNLEDAKLEELHREAQDWAGCHGLVMYTKSGNFTHAPFTLIPSPLPKVAYEQAWNVGTDFNALVHQISKDKEFILKHLEGVVEDSFTASLIEIFKTVTTEGVKQKISLGIHRSDYMLHAPEGSQDQPVLKQVELNTIAASFSNLSKITSQMHRYLIDRLNLPYDVTRIPQNDNMKVIPEALATARNLHGVNNSVVMMIVHPGETNTFDQRWIEYQLWENHQIRLIRRSLRDVHERGQINTEGHLVIDDLTVAVAYYRAGYSPDDYPSDIEWKARLLIERSLAIKCPNIAYHLIGTKKIQQVLAVPGMLERFITNKDAIERLRNSFIGLYSLDEHDSGLSELLSQVRAHPEKYVMKPQREGGGNNFYNEQIIEALDTLSTRQISSYIMMDRIQVPSVPTYFLREGKRIDGEGVSELGVFSVFLSSDDDQIVLNRNAGFLLRTKIAKVDDGGVAAGVAVLDTPYLIDQW